MSAYEIACIVVAVLIVNFIIMNIVVWLLRKRNRTVAAVAAEAPAPERELTGISFDTDSVRCLYLQGDEFDSNGLVVYAHYNTEPYRVVVNDVVVETMSAYNKRKGAGQDDVYDDACHVILPASMEQQGIQIVRGEYNGYWASYNVVVKDPIHEPIVVETPYDYSDGYVDQSAHDDAPAFDVEEPADLMDSAQMISIIESGVTEESDTGVVVRNQDGTALYFNYNKSFTAKLIQARDEVRDYYNLIKNFVISFKKVKSKISWNKEKLSLGRNNICWLVFRGKSLYVYMPLDPGDYTDTKYKVKLATSKKYEELPCVYKIKNARRAKYATELLATVLEKLGAVPTDRDYLDYTLDFPHDNTVSLIKRGLIKVTRSSRSFTVDELSSDADQSARPIASSAVRIGLRTEVTVGEAKRLMLDTEVEAMIGHSDRIANPARRSTVNIDTLSEFFDDGDTVTLDEIKQRVPGFDRNVTYVKVLAYGVLNKKLNLEVDEIHPDAAKMVVLMGGKVVLSQEQK